MSASSHSTGSFFKEKGSVNPIAYIQGSATIYIFVLCTTWVIEGQKQLLRVYEENCTVCIEGNKYLLVNSLVIMILSFSIV